MSPARDRAAAFEQWSQGGGSPRATWVITRAEAAFFVAGLRAEADRRERAAVLEGKRRIDLLERERDELRRLLAEGLEWSDPGPAATHELESLERWQGRARVALAGGEPPTCANGGTTCKDCPGCSNDALGCSC